MAHAVALLLLVVASVAATLGNAWFTYGIWPQNWGAFVGFALCSIALSVMYTAVIEDWR